MKKLIILGSNSFAGSHFVDYALRNDFKVIGINRSAEQSNIFLPYKNNPKNQNYQFYQLDLNKNFEQIVDVVQQASPDYIVDFAGQGMVAESWQNPEQWFQTNLVSKVKLHKQLLDINGLKKYIRISTPEVYGSQTELIPESFNYNPSTPYAVSHAAVDMSLRTFYKQYQFPVVFTRFSNFYGPGQQLYRIIPRTIIYALTGRKLQLHGGGVAVRAFIHGQDVASGIGACISRGRVGECYHFSTQSFISIKELVALIIDKIGMNFESVVEVSEDRPGKDAKYLMSDRKAMEELGWSPGISLEEGIMQTIRWVKENLSEIEKLSLDYQHKE